MLGLALFGVVGCTSVTTSSLHCTSLTHGEEDRIDSDLNQMLVLGGFTGASASETPWGKCWENDSFSSLWKGRADFQVGADIDSSGMNIDVFFHRGAASANKALVQAIVSCVVSNAPNAKIKIKTNTEYDPSFMGE